MADKQSLFRFASCVGISLFYGANICEYSSQGVISNIARMIGAKHVRIPVQPKAANAIVAQLERSISVDNRKQVN